VTIDRIFWCSLSGSCYHSYLPFKADVQRKDPTDPSRQSIRPNLIRTLHTLLFEVSYLYCLRNYDQMIIANYCSETRIYPTGVGSVDVSLLDIRLELYRLSRASGRSDVGQCIFYRGSNLSLCIRSWWMSVLGICSLTALTRSPSDLTVRLTWRDFSHKTQSKHVGKWNPMMKFATINAALWCFLGVYDLIMMITISPWCPHEDWVIELSMKLQASDRRSDYNQRF
jgi:hypothetical protein